MRQAGLFLVLCLAAAAAIAPACSGKLAGRSLTGGAGGGAGTTGAGGKSGTLAGLVSLAIAPQNALLEATPAMAASQAYKVTATFKDKPPADVTQLVTLAVADMGLGAFNAGTFQSSTSRGGVSAVTAASPDGTITASTGITVHFTASLNGPDGGQALPQDPSKSFQGAADPARAPQLVYPNDGVILPPNLKRLEIHWRPGSGQNTLFRVELASPAADIKIYLRCPNPTNGGCIFPLDPTGYGYLADSNRGGAPVALTVSGGDDQASGFGQSATFHLTVAEEEVNGGLYYWTTSNGTAIMRFDFGGKATTPEVFLSPGKDGFGTCVGCHALSHDGKKIVASLGGQNDGRIVYLDDVSKPTTFALNGDAGNRIQFASFNPDGSRFVAVYGDTGAPDRNTLWFHDGATGQRIAAESFQLPYEPDHPSWSPDGAVIAIDHVGQHQTSQRPFNCGIELTTKSGTGWSAPQVLLPIAPGRSRYNADFAPSSAFLLYDESTCPGGNVFDMDCDADTDPSAKIWAIQPKPGAMPVSLAKANAPGVADGGQLDLANTFPRFSPFQQNQGKGKLMYATFSSQRQAGLRSTQTGNCNGENHCKLLLLWMFAIDPAKVLAGQDGSAPPFFLPFQDLTTSNHIAQWTQVVIQGPQ